MLLVTDLEHCGFRARAAECAFDALELMAREPSDVVILDYDLPDMTGAQLAQEIRATKPLAQILLLSVRTHLPAGELVYVNVFVVKGSYLDTFIDIMECLVEPQTLSLLVRTPDRKLVTFCRPHRNESSGLKG